MMVVYRTHNPFLSHSWQARGSSNGTDNDDGLDGLEANEEEVRARNIQGRIEGAYYDDPLTEGDRPVGDSEPNGDANHLVMQPSRLHNEGNEWREV